MILIRRFCVSLVKRESRSLCTFAFCKNDATSLRRNTLLLRVFRKSPAEVCRNASESSNFRRLPPIHEDSNIDVFPRFFPSLNNFWTINFQIRSHIDESFDESDFIAGAKQAQVTVSNAIANQEYETLTDLVKEDEIQIIKMKVPTFSNEQRELIAINGDNITMAYVADTKIINNNSDESKTVRIKIGTHYLKDLDYLRKSDLFQQAELYKKNVLLCNYIFDRVYTKNSQSDWIISYVNHFSV